MLETSIQIALARVGNTTISLVYIPNPWNLVITMAGEVLKEYSSFGPGDYTESIGKLKEIIELSKELRKNPIFKPYFEVMAFGGDLDMFQSRQVKLSEALLDFFELTYWAGKDTLLTA